MMRYDKIFNIGATALSMLIALPGTVYAQADTSDWVCEYCPFEDGYRASYEAGATYVSDDAARYGNATGYDEKGGYANLDGEGAYASDGYQLDWYIEDLGLDSRVAELEGGRQGKYGFYVAYRELPYRRFDTTATVFGPSAADTLVLPQSWVPAATTGGFTELDSSLRKLNIQNDRQIIDVGGDWLPTQYFRLYADFRRQNRDGVDIKAGSGFTQSSLLPRTIDYETDQVDLGVRYRAAKGSVTLAYYGSFFTNRNSSLTWDTPFTTDPGAQQLQQAQQPDNEFQQVSLSGAYFADMWDTVVAFSAAVGKGEQNSEFLPYTINPDINTGALPQSSLNGKVDTGNYALTITARPTKRARLKLAYRYDERDNQTAQSDWTRVIVDLLNSGDPTSNVPYSFKRMRLNLSADVRLGDTLRVSGGYDRTELDRDFQEVAEQTEDTGWGQVRWQPAPGFDVRARAGAAERNVDRYDESVGQSLGQNPLMRKYNLAYRYRKFAEVSMSAAMIDSPFSFSATLLAADDDYTQSRLGMTDSSEMRATVDLSWAISDQSSAYLMFGKEEIDATQLGSEQSADADWSAVHEDTFDHLGLGIRWRQLTEKLDLRLDYSHGSGNTSIGVTSLSFGGQSNLPDLESALDSVRLEGLYRWTERLDATINVRFESFSTDDWALQDVAPDTLPTILTLGAEPYNYDVWAVGIGFRYRFGDHDTALTN